MITDPLFYVAAVPAVILLGLAKGGFQGIGLLALPLMALVISPVRAAAITLPILMIQDTVAVWAYRRTFDMRNLMILLPSATVGVAIGYLLAERVSDTGVGLAVGLLSIGFAVRQLFARRRATEPSPNERPPGLLAGWFWGILTGFTSMIGNAGGPTFQLYVIPPAPQARRLHRHRRHLFRDHQLDQDPALLRPGPAHVREPHDGLCPRPPRDRVHLGGSPAGAAVSGERFYTLIYCLLILVGIKLTWNGVAALA